MADYKCTAVAVAGGIYLRKVSEKLTMDWLMKVHNSHLEVEVSLEMNCWCLANLSPYDDKD